MTVHMSTYASQPDVDIVCGGSDIPEWGKANDHDGPVWLLQDGRRYTFEWEHVDCVDCLEKRNNDTD